MILVNWLLAKKKVDQFLKFHMSIVICDTDIP